MKIIVETLTVEQNTLIEMCAVCVSDRSGAQIALLVLITSFVLLGVANWAWKKYFKNKTKTSIEN